MRTLIRALSAACAAAAACAVPADLRAAETPVRIGLVLPDGPSGAGFAAELQAGVDLAVAASNDAKAAGATRPQVEIVRLNEPFPDRALELAARKKQVAGAVALLAEGEAADLEAVARKAKIPLVVLGAGGPVRTLDPMDPVFHVEPSHADRASALADLLRLRSARASIGLPKETRHAWLVVEDREWARAVAASLHRDDAGGLVAAEDVVVQVGGAPDAAAIAKARGAACDRVVVVGGAAMLKAVASALDTAGWSAPILCTDASFDCAAPAGPAAKARNVVLSVATASWIRERRIEDVLAKHPPATGAATHPTPTALRAFVAASALIDAAVAPASKRGVAGALRDLREGSGARCAPLFDDTGCVDRWTWSTWATGDGGVAAPVKPTFLPDASLGPLLGGNPTARYRVVPGMTCVRIGFGGEEGAPPRTIDADLATLGLNSGDPASKADTLVREQILARTASKLGRIYQRSYDGTPRPALSYRISFVTEGADVTGASVVWEATVAGDGPEGKHGGEAFPDRHRCTALATYLLRKASLLQQAKLVPPLSASDVPYLDGSYAWNTSAEGNQRSDRIRALLDGIGSTFCMKLGKETGHLAGLGIDNSGDPRSVMVTAGGEGVSDEYAYHPPAYVKILERTLGRVGTDGK